MKHGDKIKIFKGPYKGKDAIIRSRVMETDTRTGERKPGYTVWINGDVELVYDDEVKNGS